jgi:hypothetical protein
MGVGGYNSNGRDTEAEGPRESTRHGVLSCTVGWWIRILNCIEEVPQVLFSIQFKFTLDFFNWCQLELKLRNDVEI